MRALAAICFTIFASAFGATVLADISARPDLSPEEAGKVAAVLKPPAGFNKAEPFEAMAGGAATSTEIFNRDAFSQSSANLSFDGEERFKLGNALFRKLWVASPSSTLASDGLGPLFNARACQNCHLKDGRGYPPIPGSPSNSGFLIRLSVPPRDGAQEALLRERRVHALPEPTYGGQLQDLAVPGLPAEGRIEIEYEEVPVSLADGTMVSLRKPHYSILDLGYGEMDREVMLSPRLANPMIGLGLLEAIHEADILAQEDPDDKNGDGISGRANRVRDMRSGEITLGRFGWKATQPTIEQQAVHALAGDMGLSSSLMPSHYGECTERQAACFGLPHGGQESQENLEAPSLVTDLITFYSANLAVPKRRDVESRQVLRGKEVFYASGCTGCHTPKYVTRRDAVQAEHAFQLIWPYTDLLLHDMGEGLADNRPDGDATGREWRTPPLWGIGLTQTVSGHTSFLHDGRARTLLEAILWHGGEAEAAKERVRNLPPQDRAALIRFLESL